MAELCDCGLFAIGQCTKCGKFRCGQHAKMSPLFQCHDHGREIVFDPARSSLAPEHPDPVCAAILAPRAQAAWKVKAGPFAYPWTSNDAAGHHLRCEAAKEVIEAATMDEIVRAFLRLASEGAIKTHGVVAASSWRARRKFDKAERQGHPNLGFVNVSANELTLRLDGVWIAPRRQIRHVDSFTGDWSESADFGPVRPSLSDIRSAILLFPSKD